MTKQREDICDGMIKLDQDWFPQVNLSYDEDRDHFILISKDRDNSQYRVNKQIKDSVDSSKALGK